MSGKEFPNQKGFPTPNDVSADGGYIVFRLPSDNQWAGLILGAIDALTKERNWYQWGDLTPAEAAERFRLIANQAPYDSCGCNNPAGGKIIRITSGGHVEELGDDGAWHEPTGDYAIPPITPREGGTPEDQICLAATNATSVLQQLYENLTDSWNAHLDEAEALTALMLALIALVGAAFAPITFAIVTFFAWAFTVLYETLEFIGADLWDENFTKALVCILVGCASNDEGTVTFDWTCFNNALAAQVNVFSLTADQLRLFGQIQFLLANIGGVDALNTAGATTAITSADCSDCSDVQCFVWGFEVEHSKLGWDVSFGNWNTSYPYVFAEDCVSGFGGDAALDLFIDWVTGSMTWESMEVDLDVIGIGVNWTLQRLAGHGGSTWIDVDSGSQSAGSGLTITAGGTGDNPDGIRWRFLTPSGCGFGDVKVRAVRVYSRQLANLGLTPNC